MKKITEIGEKISKGANAFLYSEYLIMTIFVVIFSVVIFFVVDQSSPLKGLTFYATFSFIVGSFTSMLCGYIGMRIAVSANYRVTYLAT